MFWRLLHCSQARPISDSVSRPSYTMVVVVSLCMLSYLPLIYSSSARTFAFSFVYVGCWQQQLAAGALTAITMPIEGVPTVRRC